MRCCRLADDIVQIDPATGKVVAFYDLSTLYPPNTRSKVSEVKTRESRKIYVDTDCASGVMCIMEVYLIRVCGVDIRCGGCRWTMC